MTTVPGPLYIAADRRPVLAAITLLTALAVLITALAGLLPQSLAPAALVCLLLLTCVAAPLEVASGSLVLLLALVLAAALGIGVPLALDQVRPSDSQWLMFGAIAFLGVGLGSFQSLAPRPLCFLPGLSRWSLHWSVLIMMWLAVEAFVVWRDGLGVFVNSVVAFAAGLLIGMSLRAVGMVRLHGGGSPERLRRGINKAQHLIDQHKLRAARQYIDALLAVAPEDLAVRRMRYAAWKFEPRAPAFHRSAADLLARGERDGGDKVQITALYKDYLAVTQGRPDLPSELHIGLARRFADWDDTENAANIANLYLQRETHHPQLPDALLSLADAYMRTGRPSRAEYFADTLITMLPNSGEAQMAQRLLREIRKTRT